MDLIVLGIDGADPEYLRKAMEKYELENWEKLVGESFYTELPSTVPAITIPAWPCMFSGYTPDKFEAYHLAMADFENWGARFPDSSYFRGKMFWDRIDGKVGLHFIPGTSPVYPVNGWMRSGSLANNFEFYPDELEEELEGKLDISKQSSHSRTTASSKIKTEKENFRKEKIVSQHIYEKRPDVFVSVFQLVDRAGHFSEREKTVLRAYEYVDETIGEFIEKAEENDAKLIVVSDHGFQKAKLKFNISTFLEQEGYLEFEDGKSETPVYRLAKPFLDTGLKKYLKYAHDFFESKTGADLTGFESGALSGVSKSSRVLPYFTEGREAGLKVHTEDLPHGKVPEEEREEIVESLVEKFGSLEQDGEKLIEEVWRGEEIYPDAEDRPDVVVKARKGVIISSENSSSIFDKTNSFTHDETGVFFARGPDVDEDAEEDLYICDVAPLIYTLLGEPVPDDLDGSLPSELVPDLEEEIRSMEVEDISF